MDVLSKCVACPERVLYEKSRSQIETFRNAAMMQGEQLLDDSNAKMIASDLFKLGILDADDPEQVRSLSSDLFEFLDIAEYALNERQKQLEDFCIGSLKMRARDQHAQYEVTICRSPKNNGHDGVRHANMQEKPLS